MMFTVLQHLQCHRPDDIDTYLMQQNRCVQIVKGNCQKGPSV